MIKFSAKGFWLLENPKYLLANLTQLLAPNGRIVVPGPD